MSSELITAQRTLSRATVEELARKRSEPEWLRDLRLSAFEAFERLPTPDQRTEGWRRTSLAGLPLDAAGPLTSNLTPSIAPNDALARQAGAKLFAYRNGIVMATNPPVERGCTVMDLEEAVQDPFLAPHIQRYFAQVVPPDADKFAALHYAFFNAGVVIFVPRGTPIEQPIWLSHTFDQPDLAAFVHVLLIVEDEAELRLVDEYTSTGTPLASGVVEQVVGANAHLRYIHLQRWAPETWSFSWQRAQLAADAYLRTLNLALGARLARNTVQVVLDGRASQADLLGVVAGADRQHVDFQTLQDHIGDGTRSDLFIHNALRDRSSSNFTGLIRINKTARQTQSSQEQKNILLSPRAKADSDPKLEILNNDVIRCTHGAAVGPVDPEMIFYLQSRGLNVDAAERLIVEGFFRSILDKLEHPALQEAAWSAVMQELAKRQGSGAAP